MPHQCTNCSRVFDDGSKEMLSGCPNCGGNKFQFRPDGADASVDASAEPPEPPEPPGSSSVARTVGKTAATVRDLMGGSGSSDSSVGAEEPDSLGATDPVAPSREDTAQASARSDIVTPDELPSGVATETEHRFQPVRTDDGSDDATESPETLGGSPTPTDAVPNEGDESSNSGGGAPSAEGEPATGSTDRETDRPDLEELRAELNDQFESIKVLSPGQYELNLMELYDREEYIVALQEDGRYSIQVPENFRS